MASNIEIIVTCPIQTMQSSFWETRFQERNITSFFAKKLRTVMSTLSFGTKAICTANFVCINAMTLYVAPYHALSCWPPALCLVIFCGKVICWACGHVTAIRCLPMVTWADYPLYGGWNSVKILKVFVYVLNCFSHYEVLSISVPHSIAVIMIHRQMRFHSAFQFSSWTKL